jgi:hypothetical protein
LDAVVLLYVAALFHVYVCLDAVVLLYVAALFHVYVCLDAVVLHGGICVSCVFDDVGE